MFFLTFKLPRQRFLLCAVAALCLLGATVHLPPPSEAISCSAAIPSGKLRSNEDRVDLLRSLGWEVAEEPLAVEPLLIPREMEESDYLSLQREQGFDPLAYAGQRIKRYTYAVENYPDGTSDVQAELLVFQGHMVGGSVYSRNPDGFLKPLLVSP